MSVDEQLLEKIRNHVIGERLLLTTPFGKKPLVYADYTASGRSLTFIEDFIRNQVLPYYANTHTETSATGKQITAYREQARQCIRDSVKAGDDHAVIFSGSGATAAINKAIDILNLRLPDDLNKQYQLCAHIPEEKRPVVFIGPYEHHSNELPWRESIAEVITIPLNENGLIDQSVLENYLEKYQHRPLRIGSFSAASNVTGIKTNVKKISSLLHAYGALAFWDYAAAAPYVDIDVSNSSSNDDNSLDAVFISPHKFIGGPGTPGLLVIKNKLLTNTVPAIPGGGTVSWVSPDTHTYLNEGERKEEGGTPAIIESIRAGLVFQLKDRVGATTIEKLEGQFIQKAMERLSNNDYIDILGGTKADRISILSLRIKCAGRYLHHGFIVALLNDLFGIQVRSGCSCAGPYGHYLLDIDQNKSEEIEFLVAQGASILKPGWVRLNFNYFIDAETFDYLLSALELIANYGWRLLSHYQFDTSSGIWRYQGKSSDAVADLDSCFNEPEFIADHNVSNSPLSEYLAAAEQLLTQATPKGVCSEQSLSPESESLRWYTNASDCLLVT